MLASPVQRGMLIGAAKMGFYALAPRRLGNSTGVVVM
jgi:hypothetical protein